VAAATKPATPPQQPTHAPATLVAIHALTLVPTHVRMAMLVPTHVPTHAQLATLVPTHAQLVTSKSHFVTLPVHC
jgi:hypothetical protein